MGLRIAADCAKVSQSFSGNRKGNMCGVMVYENTDEGKEHNNTKYNKGSLCKRHHIKLFALELPGKICKGHNTGDGLDD
jgi:hypothetical protein